MHDIWKFGEDLELSERSERSESERESVKWIADKSEREAGATTDSFFRYLFDQWFLRFNDSLIYSFLIGIWLNFLKIKICFVSIIIIEISSLTRAFFTNNKIYNSILIVFACSAIGSAMASMINRVWHMSSLSLRCYLLSSSIRSPISSRHSNPSRFD